jgi:Icc-related predicted phosphoesterase
MRIIAISDTHDRHDKIVIPDGDVIIHAGDATTRGTESQITSFLDWYAKLPHKYKILVAGNHDWLFQRDPWLTRTMCWDRDIILLDDTSVHLEGVKFHGSPWSPTFFNWAFNADRGADIKVHWDLIQDDTDVLITHGPVYGILDEVVRVSGTSYDPPRLVGCEELLLAVKRVKPDLHICGHIHCGHGEKHIDGTSFYNASICDEMYYPSNPVTIIDYTK